MRRELRLPSLTTGQGVVVSITRRSTNAGIEGAGMELIRESFARMLSPTIVPFTPRVIEASAMHMPLREYRDSCGQKEKVLSAAVDAYAELASHLLSLPAALRGVA